MDHPRAAPAVPFALPRIKLEHRPMRRTDGTIQIGGDVFGIASVIEDPTGWIWRVLTLVDGEHSPEGILAAADHQPADVVEVLQALYDSGFLEDAGAQGSAVLSAAERDRYSRSQAFYRWIDLVPRPSAWTPQERIKAATVVVIGLGGTGSTTATALAAAGVGRLHCVDHDRVELSNLTRQFLYTESDVGRSKVDAALEHLRAINSTIAVTGEELKIESEDDLVRLATDADVLALCADKPLDINHWATRACATTGTPWVTGGYVGPVAGVQTFVPGTGPCFECLHLRQIEQSHGAPFVEPPAFTNDEIAASTGASAGLTGMLKAHAVIAHITGAPDYGSNFSFGMNLAAPGDQQFLVTEPHPDCPLCGPGS